MLSIYVFTITAIFCGIFLWVSIKVKDNASSSFAMYAIGGGALPLYLILFSDIATIMGAGNFIGHATHGFTKGISHIPFIFGEQGSKIIFALVFAGFAGRFTYNTVSDMMYDLMHRDKITKAITGLLTASIMVAWLGGQSKGLGYIFQQFTGINPIPVIIFFNVAFIVYTYLGGILSVVWTDFIQGVIVVAFGIVFYYFALAPIHWSLAELGSRLTEVAGPDFWDFSKVPIGTILIKFFTGCFGVLAAQVYWQRCFAAKDANTARTAMLISGVFVIIAVSLTALVGMTAKALNPGLDPSLAMPWLMMNHVPMFVVAIVFALILAAAMSSADSLLNASAIIVINDIIYPFKPDLTDAQLVSWAKKATVIIGVLASLLALYAQTIIGMFSK
ncbi:MAG: sodium:solute symporter family protein, partial [bacterium]|nr:sodium:solute symporter family protein [bacterium]